MTFEPEPEKDKHTFKPRQFRLTLTSQEEVDALILMSNGYRNYSSAQAEITRDFLNLLGQRLRCTPSA